MIEVIGNFMKIAVTPAWKNWGIITLSLCSDSLLQDEGNMTISLSSSLVFWHFIASSSPSIILSGNFSLLHRITKRSLHPSFLPGIWFHSIFFSKKEPLKQFLTPSVRSFIVFKGFLYCEKNFSILLWPYNCFSSFAKWGGGFLISNSSKDCHHVIKTPSKRTKK